MDHEENTRLFRHLRHFMCPICGHSGVMTGMIWGCIVSRDSGLKTQNNKAQTRKEIGKFNGNSSYIGKDGLGSTVLPKP